MWSQLSALVDLSHPDAKAIVEANWHALKGCLEAEGDTLGEDLPAWRQFQSDWQLEGIMKALQDVKAAWDQYVQAGRTGPVPINNAKLAWAWSNAATLKRWYPEHALHWPEFMDQCVRVVLKGNRDTMLACLRQDYLFYRNSLANCDVGDASMRIVVTRHVVGMAQCLRLADRLRLKRADVQECRRLMAKAQSLYSHCPDLYDLALYAQARSEHATDDSNQPFEHTQPDEDSVNNDERIVNTERLDAERGEENDQDESSAGETWCR